MKYLLEITLPEYLAVEGELKEALALEAWEGGIDGGNGRGLEGLPLFRELATMPG